MKTYFINAKPVYAKGLSREINTTCGFYTNIKFQKNDKCSLTIAAASVYRIFINGEFYNYGPVRCGHGTYRCDIYDITQSLNEGVNHIAIEVTGYNVNSFYTLDVPAFLQCEIVKNNEIIAATGEENIGFKVFELKDRIKKVQRYTFQRAIAEAYRLRPGYNAWHTGDFSHETETAQENTEVKNLTDRILPLHTFPAVKPVKLAYKGNIETIPLPENRWTDRSMFIGEAFKGYPENELEVHLSDEVQTIKNAVTEKTDKEYSGLTNLSKNQYEIYSFDAEYTGFIDLNIECIKDGTLYITFDETIINDDVNPLSMECVNVIRFDVKKGKYHFKSMEAYSFMHLKVMCISGEFTLSDIKTVQYGCPVPITETYNGNDPTLKKIWKAAENTFFQNTSDIPMDCPSRERAGWLCDAFFTSRTEKLFTGQNLVETVFLENYSFPDKFEFIPDGMLPMCYPSDHNHHDFIPNWAMWFVLELKDHVKRGNGDYLKNKLKDRVYNLCNYFKAFENEHGLLENLDGWIFVEWSKANELVWGVNFPTNILYASMLKAVGSLYEDKELIEKGDNIIKTVNQRSFDGEFYHDRELRENGILRLCPERTETCQYYAFFFGAATPESHPQLWKKLTQEFGPERKNNGLYPDIYSSNAFMGNYMRLDILSDYGLKKQCIDEMTGYFEYMADKTGTLWENDTDFASCNHGFASYAAYLIKKCTEN